MKRAEKERTKAWRRGKFDHSENSEESADDLKEMSVPKQKE